MSPALLLLAALAQQAPTDGPGLLTGEVRAAWTGAAVAGAEVVTELGVRTRTDATGGFALELPAGRHTLFVLAEGLVETRVAGQVVRTGGRSRSRIVLLPAGPAPAGSPMDGAVGVPMARRPAGPASEPVVLPPGWPGVSWLSVPDGPLPEEIRVGRRFERTCHGFDVQRIDTVDLDEYTKGVVNAEVGVFRSVAGGVDAAFDTWAAFAVAARSYALWFYLRDPDKEFHIDDTACNQVYRDERDPDIGRAVEATRGVVMVKADGSRTIDKFEYASSCGRHGSRPEYDDGIIPDVTGGHACVGNWCGHDNCAGHQENPNVPGGGKCLVRGVCQWGSVERSQRGDDWEAILAHYQPHLGFVGADGGVDPVESGTLVGFVRELDAASGAAIGGAVVAVADGPTSATDGEGFYRIEDLAAGEVDLTVTADGYRTAQGRAEVHADVTRWRSFALLPVETPDQDAGTDAAVLSDTGTGADSVTGSDVGTEPRADAGTGGPDTGDDLPPGSAGEVPAAASLDGSPTCGCRVGGLARAYVWPLRRR